MAKTIIVLKNLHCLSDARTIREVFDDRAFHDFWGVDSPKKIPNNNTLERFKNNSLREKFPFNTGNDASREKPDSQTLPLGN